GAGVGGGGGGAGSGLGACCIASSATATASSDNISIASTGGPATEIRSGTGCSQPASSSNSPSTTCSPTARPIETSRSSLSASRRRTSACIARFGNQRDLGDASLLQDHH